MRTIRLLSAKPSLPGCVHTTFRASPIKRSSRSSPPLSPCFGATGYVEVELAAAKALLDERRLIDRAKAILMRDRKMTEPEAYRWLQRKAMNENAKLLQIVTEFGKKEEADAHSD